MKTRHIKMDRRNEYNLTSVTSIKDNWGMPWEVSSFRVDSLAGNSQVYLTFYHNSLPYVTAKRKMHFIQDAENAGTLQVCIDKKPYNVGTWRTEDDVI